MFKIFLSFHAELFFNSNFLFFKSQHKHLIPNLESNIKKIQEGVSLKRKREDDTDCTSGSSFIQAKITDKKCVSQKCVDQLVYSFIIDGGEPFNKVENESFRNLIKGLQPTREVISKKMLVKKIGEEYNIMKHSMKADFGEIPYICITADGWSSFRRYALIQIFT